MGDRHIPVTLGRTRVVDHSLAEVDLRGRFGITVLAIRRQGRMLTNLQSSEKIKSDDILFVLGTPESVVRLNSALR